jgi:phosphatidylserine/phosphatidylglycerophosphate/cardiolipin synthase-like enzyme
MASFITTTAISSELEKLIASSEHFLFILSPYLKIAPRLQRIIAERISSINDVRIIYRKQELPKDERAWLSKLDNVGVYYCKELHAKCFINEKSAIVSSMNLYEYSQVNNYEMGILVNNAIDIDLYNPILEETIRIFGASSIKKAGYKEPTPITNYLMSYKMTDVDSFIGRNYSLPYIYDRDELYRKICEYALSVYHFPKQDMYQDGSAILRQTIISKEVFEKIVTHFASIGKKNKR